MKRELNTSLTWIIILLGLALVVIVQNAYPEEAQDKWPEWVQTLLFGSTFVKSEHEDEIWYATVVHEQKRYCLKFRQNELSNTLAGLDTGQRYAIWPLLLAKTWTDTVWTDLDTAYCYADELPALTYVVADNFWSDTRPLYAWVDGQRGKQIGRIIEGSPCEKIKLMQSTRGREWRYATNRQNQRGAVVCQKSEQTVISGFVN